MADPNQQNNSSEPATLPTKRKRGRPRKEDVPGSESGPRTQRQSPNPSPTSAQDTLGQHVTGTIDGVFDAGFLISVRVSNDGPLLKGMVFDKRLSVPISNENDIAPHIKMSMSDDFPIPMSVEPLQRRDPPSVPPSVPKSSLPNDGGQGSALVLKVPEATVPAANLSTVQVSDQGEERTGGDEMKLDSTGQIPPRSHTLPSGDKSKDGEADGECEGNYDGAATAAAASTDANSA